MVKSTFGAITGAATLGVLLPGAALLLEWIDLGTLLPAVGACALAGLVLGWLKPGFFLGTVLFFLEGDLFD